MTRLTESSNSGGNGSDRMDYANFPALDNEPDALYCSGNSDMDFFDGTFGIDRANEKMEPAFSLPISVLKFPIIFNCPAYSIF